MMQFGVCDIDGKDCFAKGAICRLNHRDEV
jgi:hypothetical protein